jgi:hypothetical protein
MLVIIQINNHFLIQDKFFLGKSEATAIKSYLSYKQDKGYYWVNYTNKANVFETADEAENFYKEYKKNTEVKIIKEL